MNPQCALGSILAAEIAVNKIHMFKIISFRLEPLYLKNLNGVTFLKDTSKEAVRLMSDAHFSRRTSL